MAKQRRGDDAPVAKEPAVPVGPESAVPASEVTGEKDGFPVSAAPAPEAHGEGTAPDHADEPRDPIVDPAVPLLKINFTFHREFRKHSKTGDLVAIELANGVLFGVRRCSKPEEQTAGALPVMQLESLDSDVGQWYRAEQILFKTWEPPLPPRQLLDRLGDLYEQAVAARSKYESAKLTAKHAKERVEEVDEAIFHALRRMHDVGDQAELPLEPTPVEEQPDPSLPLDAAEETAGDSSIETDPPGFEPEGDGEAQAQVAEQLEDGEIIDAETNDDLVIDPDDDTSEPMGDDYQANNT